MRDRGDLLVLDPDGAARLAVLREHELALPREARADLAELAQLRVEPAPRAAVQTEARHRMIEDVRHDREPVHSCPACGRGARLCDRVSVPNSAL